MGIAKFAAPQVVRFTQTCSMCSPHFCRSEDHPGCARVQEPISVEYEGQVVGEYYADLWVDGRVVVELKAAQALAKEHEVKLVNYLTATRIDHGLLLNFGPSVQVKRKFREYKPKGSLMSAILPAS